MDGRRSHASGAHGGPPDSRRTDRSASCVAQRRQCAPRHAKQRVMLAPAEKQLSLTDKRPYGGMTLSQPRRSIAKATAPEASGSQLATSSRPVAGRNALLGGLDLRAAFRAPRRRSARRLRPWARRTCRAPTLETISGSVESGRPTPTRTRRKSAVPRPSLIDLRPLWPPWPPPSFALDPSEGEVDLVVDHEDVVGLDAQFAARRADGLAALVHVGLGDQHARRAGRRGRGGRRRTAPR